MSADRTAGGAARGAAFAALAYKIIVSEKAAPLRDIAERMGMGYDALSARLRNRTPFSAEEICALIRAVPDSRLAAHLLDGSQFLPARRVQPDSQANTNDRAALLMHRAAIMSVEAAEALDEIERALRDGVIDHREHALIMEDIRVAEEALATLRLHVEESRR